MRSWAGNGAAMSDRTPGAAVLVEDDGQVRALTLHQPGRHNALDPTGRQELLTALRAASRDERCRAVVLTGARGSFCAGGGIRSMTPVPEESVARTEAVAGIVRAIVRGPEPVLVAVEGVAFGLRMSLAAACDYVVASRDAQFGCASGRIGLVADAGPLWSLPARVGPGTAKRLLLFGDVLDSGEVRPLSVRPDALREPGSARQEAVRLGRTARRRRSVLHRGDQADPGVPARGTRRRTRREGTGTAATAGRRGLRRGQQRVLGRTRSAVHRTYHGAAGMRRAAPATAPTHPAQQVRQGRGETYGEARLSSPDPEG